RRNQNGGVIMSVRKRTWRTEQGAIKEAWVVDYVDQAGRRHVKTFARKRDADAYHATANVEGRRGLHTADSVSITGAEAGERWLVGCDAAGLGRATVEEYRRHLRLHITPHVGAVKLSRLTAPMVSDFRMKLRQGDASPAMVKKVLTSLSSIVADAQEA